MVYSEGNKLALIITSRVLSLAAGSNLPGPVTLSEQGRLVSVVQPERGTSSCMSFDDLTIAGPTQITPSACSSGESVVTITNSLTVNSELQLQGTSPVLHVSMSSAPASDDLRKAFVEVNGEDGIQSFGGKLRLSVMGLYRACLGYGQLVADL